MVEHRVLYVSLDTTQDGLTANENVTFVRRQPFRRIVHGCAYDLPNTICVIFVLCTTPREYVMFISTSPAQGKDAHNAHGLEVHHLVLVADEVAVRSRRAGRSCGNGTDESKAALVAA